MKFKRKYNCHRCNSEVYYDSETSIMSCDCRKVKIRFIWRHSDNKMKVKMMEKYGGDERWESVEKLGAMKI